MQEIDELPEAASRAATPAQQALAWGAHLYTAIGLIAAAGIAVCIVRGGVSNFRWAFLLMLVAFAVDATDGTLARRLAVKRVLPGFDGRRLDDLIDFLTYAFLPLLLVWRAEVLPSPLAAWLLVPLVASAYGFCQVSIKTADGYFLGFPSYWNVVAFYLYLLRPPVWLSLTLLLGLAVLTFVPTKYLYPSQRGPLSTLTNVLGAVWGGVVLVVLYLLPSDATASAPLAGRDGVFWLTCASLFYPVYYLVISWAMSWAQRAERLPADETTRR
jgi:phosphatidylcholine synthase